ncbi:MAG: hypothetical protein EON97_00045 [Chitinophagaceae bacterium]|nr:MAG: hypothetical protein EON97_00045 [Chitinophagaceae bacterium]
MSFIEPFDSHDDNLPGEPRKVSIIIENEILMMKLNAEFGAQIFLPDNRASPEIENHFLRSVYEYEQQFTERSPPSKVFLILGSPHYELSWLLNDEQISNHLDRLMDLMYEHKIVLDTLDDYPDRKLYEFITDEFFWMELEYPGNPEYYMHFCYEDFHPNHEYDVRQAAAHFITYLMELVYLLPNAGLHRQIIDRNGKRIVAEEAIKRIETSCQFFTSRRLISFSVRQVVVLEASAFVEFDIAYSGVVTAVDETEVKGEGRFEFVLDEEMWWVVCFHFPGVVC